MCFAETLSNAAESHDFGEGSTSFPLMVLLALVPFLLSEKEERQQLSVVKFCNINRSLVVFSLKCHSLSWKEPTCLLGVLLSLALPFFSYSLSPLSCMHLFFPCSSSFYICTLLAVSFSSSINKISLGGFCMKKTQCVVWKI